MSLKDGMQLYKNMFLDCLRHVAISKDVISRREVFVDVDRRMLDLLSVINSGTVWRIADRLTRRMQILSYLTVMGFTKMKDVNLWNIIGLIKFNTYLSIKQHYNIFTLVW